MRLSKTSMFTRYLLCCFAATDVTSKWCHNCFYFLCSLLTFVELFPILCMTRYSSHYFYTFSENVARILCWNDERKCPAMNRHRYYNEVQCFLCYLQKQSVATYFNFKLKREPALQTIVWPKLILVHVHCYPTWSGKFSALKLLNKTICWLKTWDFMVEFFNCLKLNKVHCWVLLPL